MTDNEREMLRERDQETSFGERAPYESSRQATYEDSVRTDETWNSDNSEPRDFS